jgi:FlaA1/EpsC-like NDP-sugar epimerase
MSPTPARPSEGALASERFGRRARLVGLVARQLQFVLDLSVLVGAFAISYLLRFEFSIPKDFLRDALVQAPYVVLVQFSALVATGVYSFIWRYVGMRELGAFARAVAFAAVPVLALRVGLPPSLQSWRVPLSIIIMDTVLVFAGVVGLRTVRRVLHERVQRRLPLGAAEVIERKPVLLVGAGRAGVLAAREIQGRGETALQIRGFVDDDPDKQGSVIHGVKVLGKTEDLPRLVREIGVDHVVITIAQGSRKDIRRIVTICETIPIKVRIIPGLFEILQGQVSVSVIRDLNIEDVLGREPVQLDEAEVQRFVVGKTVMVTGAGGSIGSELARQVARFGAARLLLVERAEPALFMIDRELRAREPEVDVVPLIADIGDEARMRGIFACYRPALVIHAAAHKHVPLMEQNPTEAVKNNVLATHQLARLAGEADVEAFVQISTDKAVRPTSIMGASKRAAELLVQDLQGRHRTRYVAVRFGNVIGSAGSVIPVFREQILKGGPVTVTHPDMVRYFMTIPEASQLVLQAGAMGAGGEIFILDMGEPVRILDVAKDMITFSGLKPFEDVDIVFTGMRPGEKLFEELQTTGETIAKTRHPKIFIGKIARCPEDRVRHALARFSALAREQDEPAIRRLFAEFVPESDLTLDAPVAPRRAPARDEPDARSSVPEPRVVH